MVYTSSSLSLAAIEVFVHLDATEEPDLLSIEAELPADDTALEAEKRTLVNALPANWREINSSIPRQIGADWIQQGRSLAMLVPSVAIDGEWNVLINPAHRNAARIKFEEPKPFHFDPRMFHH